MKKLIILAGFCISGLQAQNLIVSEQFTSCTLPEKWSLNTEAGPYSFAVMKSNLMPQSDATCTIVYQQTDKNNTDFRKFSIATKVYPLFRYTDYKFVFGMRFVRAGGPGQLKLYSLIEGTKTLLQSYTSDIMQNGQVLVNQNFDIKATALQQSIQFIFEYESNGNDVNTVLLLDNLTFTGPDNDDCSRAVEIYLDAPCLSGNNTGALLTGPKVSCQGSYTQALWYKLTSTYTGSVRVMSRAGFNDALSIFEGPCANLTDLQCINTDEYGFGGEDNYFTIEAGKTYYFRVVRQLTFYGRDDLNDLCISISKEDPVYPDPDLCTQSKLLNINGICLNENTKHARFDKPEPSLNFRSRADVWYHFIPSNNTPLEIISNANFADVLTLYKGECNQLTEVQCEHLGNKIIFQAPVANTKYYLQVSGYFSTIEGDLCVEIKSRSSQKPANEDCINATPVVLGQTCVQTQNINSLASNVKGSCMVYAAPDIWYSFIAPAEKEIALSIKAGFMFNYTIYEGPCNKLTELTCGKQPDPCSGFIPIKGLTAGKTYYLQIAAIVHPLRVSESSICVKMDALSQVTPQQSLDLNLTTECLHGVLGSILYTATGGTGPYTYYGPKTDEFFLPGTKIEAFIEDASGCRDFESLTIQCSPPEKCKNSTLDLHVKTTCLKDSIGRQTGQVQFEYEGAGGSGVYYYYGTSNGSTLQHGDLYQIVIIDSDSCYIIEEGKINCPPFDCSQSALRIESNYTCIDTLLKARLDLQVSGDLGGYTLTGNQPGELLEQGSVYQTIVTDAAGCSVQVSGEIKCNFDSCAYARPDLNIDYTCLTHANGDRTGKAILHVSASSYAGGLMIKGNHDGDTLNHTDSYHVQLTDAFGCSLTEQGIIDCLPVKTKTEWSRSVLRLYPNPAYNKLTLQAGNTSQNELYFSLFNSSGKSFHLPISRVTTDGNLYYHIPIEHLPSGIYYLKVQNRTTNDILRFVKL